MTDMEKRCPFCYSNRIEPKTTEDRKAKYQCGKCFNDFDEDYVLYAPKKKSARIDERVN